MTLRKTIEVVARLAEQGAMQRYAIAGAVAALNYIQPSLTEDPDILVSVEHFEKRPSGLILLAPLESALRDMGYAERTDLGYLIEGWPVDSCPSPRNLTKKLWTKRSTSISNSPAIRR
jgi:hypothetical protein